LTISFREAAACCGSASVVVGFMIGHAGLEKKEGKAGKIYNKSVMMFVYGRDAEWIRFFILLFSGSAAVVMAAYFDVDKGMLVFKTAKKA
jgi:hypothetical protein